MADPFLEWITIEHMELSELKGNNNNDTQEKYSDKLNHEEAEFQANAVASAMVGETIMDMNIIQSSSFESRRSNNDSNGNIDRIVARSLSLAEQRQQLADDENESYVLGSVGRWWYQRNRRKRRENLQREVEKQQEILKKESDHLISGSTSGGSDGEGVRESYSNERSPSAKKYNGRDTKHNGASFCEMIGGGSSYQASSGSFSSTSSLKNLVNDHATVNNSNNNANIQSNEISSSSSVRKVSRKTKSRRGKKQKDVDLVDLNNKRSLDSSGEETNERDAFAYVSIVPEPNCDVPPILTIGQMKSIVSQGLPSSLLYSKWKRLYSLQRDGDSFEGAFLPRVLRDNRTVLVIKTTCGSTFGGFADSTWRGTAGNLYASTVTDASFYGSAQACLFTCNNNDDHVSVYKWSGANHYCQICDVQNKMIGFGGGGDSGEFGLCVEENFQRGSTGPCETFRNPPLCPNDRFEIMDVECWGFVIGIV